MRVYNTALLVVLCLASFIHADFIVPEQTIKAPKEIEVGKLINVKVSDFKEPESFAGASYKWKVYDLKTGVEEDPTVWPDGKSIFFATGNLKAKEKCKTFVVLLSASYLYLVKEKDVIKTVGQRSQLLMTQVKVISSDPIPEPDPTPIPPTPTPTPTPVFPPGKYGFSKQVYDMANLDVLASANRLKGAQALANSFNGMASATKAGTIKSIKELLTATTASNQSALVTAQVPSTEWAKFSTDLQTMIFTQYDTDKLATLDDFVLAWQEIADGLSKVK